MTTLRNSQIRNYDIINHGKRHADTPFELIWAYRSSGPLPIVVSWRFFRLKRDAQAFANDLVNAVVNADGSEKLPCPVYTHL